MQSGTSVRLWTSGIACPISPTSSASCSATSTSIRDRSPAWSWVWNAFRPVGLIRSPITQNGCSGPMTTVLDRDWTTVSTHLPFLSGGNVEALAEPGDAGLFAEADQVEAGDPGQRARVLGELACDVEARLLRVGRAFAAFDRLLRDRDAGHVLVHVAKRARRAHQADRRDERARGREPSLDCFVHERGEPLRLVADLQLEEARARSHLLQRPLDAVVVRRRAGVLDRAEEELRRR